METYPDPDVLALTNNFTRHPSEYISGYPADSPAIRATLGQGYFPGRPPRIWNLKRHRLERASSTGSPARRSSALSRRTLACSNCAAGAHDPRRRRPRHGLGLGGVGNRYGYCGRACSSSRGPGRPRPAPPVDVNQLEHRGVPSPTCRSDLLPAFAREAAASRSSAARRCSSPRATAPPTRSRPQSRPTARPDGPGLEHRGRRDPPRQPAPDHRRRHPRRTSPRGVTATCRPPAAPAGSSQCAFGGTSAATPYTAGVFGNVLTGVRRRSATAAPGSVPARSSRRASRRASASLPTAADPRRTARGRPQDGDPAEPGQ